MPGKSDSVHFLRLPQYDESRLNAEAVEAMETLQSIVEQGRNAREKRNISLKFPVKNVVAILRSPSAHVVKGLTGPLKKYILSELNVWDFQIVPKEQEHDWVTLSLSPNFKVLGKKLGKKMKDVQMAVTSMTHEQAVKCLEEGKLEVADTVLDMSTEVESKFEFSKEGEYWESTSKADGSLVVAVDCTQDSATLSSGMSRELMNGIQQLRKSAGLDPKDVVEVFFEEENGVKLVEDSVGGNLALFEAKLKGAVPLPQRFCPPWSVTLKSDSVDVGGTQVKLSICRPAIAARDDLEPPAQKVLSTLEPSSFAAGQEFNCSVDKKRYNLKEGVDFWLSATAKVRTTKDISWL
jgi:isoleucyl-tRNA synthetase